MANLRPLIILSVLLCSSLVVRAYSEGAIGQLLNLCSNVEVRAIAANDYQSYSPKAKRSAIWFGPRMGKRQENSDLAEEQIMPMFPAEIHEFIKRELDDKLGPDAPWVVYLVNEHPNKYMTPRMGRGLSERCLELQMIKPPMGPRMGRRI